MADLSFFSFSSNTSDAQTSISYTYIAFGANYYFINEGKGLYGGIGYGRPILGFDYSGKGYTDDLGIRHEGGKGSGSVGMNMFQFKLGYKTGGTVYIKPEIGYSISSLDDYIEIEYQYSDGYKETTQESTDDVPSGVLGVMFTLGLGVQF